MCPASGFGASVKIFSSPMGGGGITLFVLGGWKHLPIIGSGWVLALGTVFSGLSVALANEASKAEDATRASVAHSITVAYKPSHSGSPRRKTKTSVLSFPRSFGPHPNFFGTIRRYGRYPYWHCRRSMVMSQLSSPTPRRKSRYRGYDIKMERRDLCWMVTMKPSRPGLPKFPQPSFQTATQSTREALSQAKRRVDHALARSMLSATSRSGRKINAALR